MGIIRPFYELHGREYIVSRFAENYAQGRRGVLLSKILVF